MVTRESEGPLWSGLVEFEAALTKAFPDLQVVGRGRSPVAAIEWVRGKHQSPSWMDGSVNDVVTAMFLEGDDRLVYETALWLQRSIGDGVLTWEWQGIPFALARIESVEALMEAVDKDDDSLDYRRHVTFTDAD